MARCTPILLIILIAVPLYQALDCRKFSFAPACRGIMLKRSGAHAIEQAPMMEREKIREIEALENLIKQLYQEEALSGSDCVSLSGLHERLESAKRSLF